MLPAIIPENDLTFSFPDVETAFEEPNGLLAVGGDLSPERLLAAYQKGIFPWFSHDQPILWWSPDPRMVLFPEHLRVSRSLKKSIRKSPLEIRVDSAFENVMQACAQPRVNEPGTWITPAMLQSYCILHQLGHAHSFEAWRNDQLVGGLYGIAIGQVFFGESMFSIEDNASKIAFVHSVEILSHWGYTLIDCQVETQHLATFGAENISRPVFSDLLAEKTRQPVSFSAWKSTI